MRKYFMIIICIVIGTIGGYSIRFFQEIIIPNSNQLWTGDGYYKVANLREFVLPQNLSDLWMKLFNRNEVFHVNTLNELQYCGFVFGGDNQLPDVIGGWYVRIKNSVFYQGKKITVCSADCLVSDELPYMLFNGNNTFYRGELLSGFDYNNLVVLDEVFTVFTDKKKVYFQGTELPDMDWTTFSHPKKNIQEFKDKNYTYTFVSSETGMQVQRIDNLQ